MSVPQSGLGTGRGGGKRWSKRELAIVRKHFPQGGVAACGPMLKKRTVGGIRTMARHLGIEDPCKVVAAGLRAPLRGGDLDRALALRADGWSYAAIGREFGVCESSATNAVLIGQCIAAGHVPAKRDSSGGLVVREVKRLRAFMMEGLRGTEIQLRMGISAGCISAHRRRFMTELRARGQGKTLPVPGAGEAYSGRKIPAEQRRDVERLLLQGLGTFKVSERTGVSKTHVGRARNRLIKRLARKGECLPGCDLKGVRHHQAESSRFIPPEAKDELRRRLLAREPVRRAALAIGMGLSSAYRLRDELSSELALRGENLPAPILPGRGRDGQTRRWLPADRIYRYRKLCQAHGPEEGRRLILQEMAAERETERTRRKSFEEQLQAVRDGAGLTSTFTARKPAPDATLGGISTGMMA